MFLKVLFILNFLIFHCECDYNDSAAQCKWRYNYPFPTVKSFTDYMCADCYWRMADYEVAWHNFSKVNMLQICYDPETTSVYLCENCNPRSNCKKMEYNKLNISDKDNDFILQEFSSSFHMV